MTDRSYRDEKLRAASTAITEMRGPIRKRLRSAYIYGLSLLEPSAFEDDAEAQAEFEAIRVELLSWSEAREGGGNLDTTLGLMSADAAEALAARIVALADRYGQG
jgi:hypothetical protein